LRILPLLGLLLLLPSILQASDSPETKEDIVRRLHAAASEVGGTVQEHFEKELIPFFEAHGQIGELSTYQGSHLSMMKVTPNNARESVVILVGQGCSWVENLELIYDQYQHGRQVFIFDPLGQGLSSRVGHVAGSDYVPRFDIYRRDMNQFMENIVEPQATGPLHLITHSTGGAIGHDYLLNHPNVFKDAVHVAPLFKIIFPKHVTETEAKVEVRFDELKNGPDSEIQKVRVEPPGLQDRRKLRWALNTAFQDKGGVMEPPSARWVSELIDETELLRKRAGDIKTPFLVVQAGQDRTVDNPAEDQVVRDSAPGVAHMIRLPDVEHMFFYQNEDAMKDVLRSINGFLGEREHTPQIFDSPKSMGACLLQKMRDWLHLAPASP
jgi:lysophospholipase